MQNAFGMPIYNLPSSRAAFLNSWKSVSRPANDNRTLRNWTLLLTFGSIFTAVLSAVSIGLLIAGLD